MACALGKEEANSIAIASDSAAAFQSVRNLSNSHPPRSDIERRIKAAIRAHESDVGLPWVWGHIGITGNEKADFFLFYLNTHYSYAQR